MGHRGDSGAPSHAGGVESRLGTSASSPEPAQVPPPAEEHGRGAAGGVQKAQLRNPEHLLHVWWKHTCCRNSCSSSYICTCSCSPSTTSSTRRCPPSSSTHGWCSPPPPTRRTTTT